MDFFNTIGKLTHILEITEEKKKESFEKSITFDSELALIFKYLCDIDVEEYTDTTEVRSPEEIIKYDKKFFKDNLPIQKVLAFDQEDNTYYTNPFNLIEFINTGEKSYVDYCKILSGKHRGKIGFEGVYILDELTKLGYGYLAHEIVHTQIEKNPNSLTNYYNREFLSIFVEMLISKSIDDETLNGIILYRYENVLWCLYNLKYIEDVDNFNDECDFKCYLASSLKALKLYNIYESSSIDRKLNILGLIVDVFRNQITVEELLRRVDVTYDNSKDVELVKQYVKR